MPCLSGTGHIDSYDICDVGEWTNSYVTPYLLHFMLIPLFVTVILTLLDRSNEDVKWFNLNTAVINIITGITWEIKLPEYTEFAKSHKDSGNTGSIIDLVFLISRDLSQYSIFLLAVTRVFILYWPNLYKRIFGRKFLLVWILYADILLAGVSLVLHNNEHLSTRMLYTTMELGLLFGTYACAVLVLGQIQKMKKEVDHWQQSGIYDALRRASFVCLFQAFLYTVSTALAIYMRLYTPQTVTSSDTASLTNFFNLSLDVIGYFHIPLFLIFTTLDTVIPLIILRTYKTTIRRLFTRSYDIVTRRKSTTTVTSMRHSRT
ncbi:hypothetical protein Ddc_11199 [Ditylenchus destructor]|nr:hypothetical protein Ddc_11199 [Ditylenchus destructor]